MKKTLTIFTAILISSLIITSIAIFSPVSAQTKYKVWGYVLNSDGQGLAGADVIFNVPQTVPGCVTNASGYYEMNAPAGTYHVNVWPPYDSSYINYDDLFAVSSDMAKNITLQSGCKVSGYVTNTAGNPIVGAVVLLGGYGSGYFTTGSGYYFLSVPAGTYKIDVHPRVGTYQSPTSQFSAYSEDGFQVTGTTNRNIIVNQQTNPTASPPSQPTPTSNPTQNPTPTATPSPTKYKISGYIQDQNGHGLPGACIVFNANIVPKAFSDSSGYYQIYAPAGTYHLNVWPPFNSSCINYDETGFTVSQAGAKNITLTTGYKVAGFVKDSQGTPMVGASVLFKVGNTVYGSGYFTGTVGYYYAAIPAGTYTIDAHPQTAYDPSYSGACTNFPTYLENNFAVNQDTAKNITVNTAPTPTANPTNPPSQPNPTSNPSPTATPEPNPPPSHITIKTDASTYNIVGSKLTIEGKLTDQNMNQISNETVIFSYSLADKQSWSEIGAAKTNSSGDYSIQWINNASGTFTLKAAYQGNSTQSGAEVTTTLSFLPYQDQKVFFVESNSTVTLLDFNTETLTLGFTVSGESGSTGYTKVTIAKSLIENFTGFTVNVDQTPVDSNVTSSGDYWIVEFNYHHSTHQVTVGLTGKAQSPFTANIPILVGIAVVIVAVAVGSFIAIRRLQRNK